MIDYPKYKVAAAHIAPEYYDVPRSVDKACAVIADAARQGVKLIAFAETFIPGYPNWARLIRPIESDEFFCEYAARSIRVDGPEIARLREAARKSKTFVSIGFSESTPVSVGCLWNSNVMIGPDGSILSHHRKLVPTYVEKLIFTSGDGAGLRVCNTDLGRIGMLICGENTNPLARFALMAQGEQVHIASYPSVAPARPTPGTGAYNIQDGIRIRAASHSFEAKVFTIVAAAPFDASARKALAHIGEENLQLLDNGSRATSFIIDPAGRLLTDVMDKEEGLAIAEIDLKDCVPHKRMHDVVGYYNRFDVFNLTVNRTANRPATFVDHAPFGPLTDPDLGRAPEEVNGEAPSSRPVADGLTTQ